VLHTTTGMEHYILQGLNTTTFPAPFKVMKNLKLIQDHLALQEYPFQVSSSLQNEEGLDLYKDAEGTYWRMSNFIAHSISFETPPSTAYLYEAGAAYGVFLSALRTMNPEQLEMTIPDFHHLDNRFHTFQTHLENATAQRKEQAKKEIEQILKYYEIFDFDFSKLPLRVVHNDSKLSNLLFHTSTQKCIAVIDLDTVMPGYVITDFGDMVRGMCNRAKEDEADLEKVSFDKEAYEVLSKGFLATTKDWLSIAEENQLLKGAIYIILEQAIRFLSDYLNNDQYYPTKYEHHNYDRGRNQLKLLDSLLASGLEY